MKLLFKQRLFSWLDSYDIYDEMGNTVFTVKGKLALGHCLEIYDYADRHVGTVKEEVLTLLPRFAIYDENNNCMGEIKKEFTFFKPKFTLNCNNWNVEGNFLEWEYEVHDGEELIMKASKELLRMTDTYVIDVQKAENQLLCLMIVLAIDAVKCSQN